MVDCQKIKEKDKFCVWIFFLSSFDIHTSPTPTQIMEAATMLKLINSSYKLFSLHKRLKRPFNALQ
jgi:hypothetical protein